MPEDPHDRPRPDYPTATLGAVVDRFETPTTLVVDLEAEAPPLQCPAQPLLGSTARQWLMFSRAETSASELIAAVASRARLVDLTLLEPAIEDIIRGIYDRCTPAPGA